MILCFSGRKQSGKTTAAKLLFALKMGELELIDEFKLHENGKLYMPFNVDGHAEMHEFDIERNDYNFVSWMQSSVWPHVKNFALADEFKRLCINMFGLHYDQVYGTDEQKNSLTKYKWEDLPVPPAYLFGKKVKNEWADKKGNLTARQFMQYVGSEVLRSINPMANINGCLNNIEVFNSEISIVTDVRYQNEVETFKEKGAKVIRFTRKIEEDQHSSENDLDSYTGFDFIIDNKDMSFADKCLKLHDIYVELGLIAPSEEVIREAITV